MDMIKKIYINYDQMHGHVNEILRQINDDQWKPDYIVGLVRGGLLPAVLISQYLNVPMYTLKVSFRDGSAVDCETNAWMAEDAFGYAESRKNILVVDDINDSGATIGWIKSDWPAGCHPTDSVWTNEIWGNNVRFATVVNNIASSEDVTYSSMEINKEEDPSWIVFPFENWWINK